MPTEIASDTFTNTNGTDLDVHNASWVQFTNSIEIQSNRATGVGSSNNMAAWNGAFADDQYSEVLIVADGSDQDILAGPAVRVSDAAGGGDGYFWRNDGNTSGLSQIMRIDNGSITNLIFHATVFPVTGDLCRLEIKGDVITAFINGESHLQVVDSNYSFGDAGVYCFGIGTNVRLESWSGGNLNQIASDTFTNTNGTALTAHNASWVNFRQAIEIQSNAASNNASGIGLIGWNATFSNDQYSEIIATLTGSSGAVVGPMVRMTDAASGGDGYVWITDGGAQSELFRIDNGASTSLIANDAENPVSGDTMRIEVRGNRITCKLNGIKVMTIVETTYTTGDAGIGFSGNTQANRANSWAGGDLDEMQMIIMPYSSWT